MKYLLVFILGFITHKALEEVYDYSFNKGFASKICTDQYLLDIKNINVNNLLTKRFECTYKEMGVVSKLSYILLRPHYFDESPNKWYY